MQDSGPCPTLARRLAIAGFAATGLPVAAVLGVLAGSSTLAASTIAVGVGAWLTVGAVLALATRRLAAPMARLAAATAERAAATQASLEQQVAARTIELSDARDRAEREARLKGVFLAAMSHEIRTPMNSIVGMAELMAETPLDGEQREYCDTIRTSTDALLGVINDILDFSKIEAQGVTLEAVPFDLRVVVEDAVELLAVKAAITGIDLAAHVEPGADLRFRGDPSRLRQVLVNLLGNAVKFTAQGSVVVRVTTARAADAGQPDGDDTRRRVRVEVVDSGIGMGPEGLARLFRPFVQADAATARHFGGTGLGLTISKQIVERMGGAIGVESAPGRGSTFWFEVPLPATDAIATPPAPARFAGEALVLEPRDHSGEALRALLADLGVGATRVATAGDGLAALDARGAAFTMAFVSVDAVDAAPFVDALQQADGAGTAIVAIVPAGTRTAGALDRLGALPRLTRPLRRGRLVDCLDAIASQRPPVPAVLPIAAPAAEPVGSAGTRGAPRVLVADDYFANLRLVTRLLERRGYVVETVGDGQAAVDAVADRRFDVVLMDCNMPVLDGYAATGRIRALEQDRRTPILAMTANDSPEDRDACLRAGMDDYLVKPIQASLVLAALARWAPVEPRSAAPAPAGPASVTGAAR